MCEEQKLTRLIAGIYDAALDSARWGGVLVDIADFVDGQVGGILAKDATRKYVNAHCYAGLDPHYMKLYTETYSKLGPVALSPFGDVEQVLSVPELVPYDEFRRGRFYQEWARPQGWVDVAVAVLDKSAGGHTSAPPAVKHAAWSTTRCASACRFSSRMCAAPS